MKAKKILAILLSVIMLVGMMATVVSAEGEAVLVADYDSLVAAIANGGEIKLTADITTSKTINITASVVIDGDNHTITYTGTDRALDVKKETNGADLTLKKLTIVCGESYCQRGVNYNTTGTLTLDDVTLGGDYTTYAINLPGSADGAKVEITNSDIKGLIALNVWGENAVINVTDTALTSVDNQPSENYCAVKLNNDGTTSAEGSVITITGGTITALDENGEPSEAIGNATATGTITVSDSTVVTGVSANQVAIVDYGTTEFYSFETLQDAIAKAAEDGAKVKLLKDVELTEKIVIDKPVVIDGNDHKVTTSAKKLFEVFADFSVSNLNMESTASGGRCVDTRVDGITVDINNCELLSSGTGWAQPLTIGGSSEAGLTINVTDSKITSSKYVAIIAFVPVDLTISNSEISGYAAIYAKGIDGNTTGSKIDVVNSDLLSENKYSEESNSFATIAIEDDGVELSVDADSSIKAAAEGDSIQAALSMLMKASTAVVDCPVELTGENAVVLVNIAEDTDVTVTNAEVVEALKAEGYDVDASGKVSEPGVEWLTDTDAGFYMEEETKYGLLRFLFSVDAGNEAFVESGIKYIKPSNISDAEGAEGVVADANGASTFYGDINGIPEEAEGKSIVALAYIKTAQDVYHWSQAVIGTVDMTNQQFTDYVAGGAQ